MTSYAKLSHWLSICTVSTALLTSACQLPSTMSMAAHDIRRQREEGNGTIIKPLFLPAEYFYDTQTSPTYELFWALQFSSTVIGASYFGATDALFAVIVLHLSAQLNNFKDFLNDLPLMKVTDNKSFEELMSIAHARHEHLYKLVFCFWFFWQTLNWVTW